MKTILLIPLLFIAAFAHAQDTIHFVNGKTQIAKVIKIDNRTETVTVQNISNTDTTIIVYSGYEFESIHFANGEIYFSPENIEPAKTHDLTFTPGRFLVGWNPNDLTQIHIHNNYYNRILSVYCQYQFWKGRCGIEIDFRKGFIPPFHSEIININPETQHKLYYEFSPRFVLYNSIQKSRNFFIGIGGSTGKSLTTNIIPVFDPAVNGGLTPVDRNYMTKKISHFSVYGRIGLIFNPSKMFNFSIACNVGYTTGMVTYYNDSPWSKSAGPTTFASLETGIAFRIGSKNTQQKTNHE